jgi:DNA repair protein RecO (recombination protein O)
VKSYAVEAFVLRMRPLGEADRILTLFSRERGKLSAVAKGSRKTQSKFGARLEFFARSQLTLHAGRSLDVITSASLVAGAWERLVDPDVYSFASYVAEVIDGMCELEMPLPDLYELLVELQGAMETSGVDAGGLRAVFDLRVLSALGFGLELDACARCGAVLGRRPFAGGRAALSPEAGGLVCRQCLDSGSGGDGEMRRDLSVVRITSSEFELLKSARDLPFADVAELPELAPLARVTEAFVQHHLGRASRALSAARGKVQVRSRSREAAARR